MLFYLEKHPVFPYPRTEIKLGIYYFYDKKVVCFLNMRECSPLSNSKLSNFAILLGREDAEMQWLFTSKTICFLQIPRPGMQWVITWKPNLFSSYSQEEKEAGIQWNYTQKTSCSFYGLSRAKGGDVILFSLKKRHLLPPCS